MKGNNVEVRIGVRHIARELVFETDDTAEVVSAAVEAALREGTVLSLTDDKGRHYLVPADAVGFVHLGDTEKSRVGIGIG